MVTHRWRLKRMRRAAAAGLAVLALAGLCAGARAQDSTSANAPPGPPANATDSAPASPPADAPNDGIVRTVAKKLGLATDPGQPQDFVIKSRPTGPLDYIPAGRKPFVHDNKVKTPDELKALDDDLDATLARHDAIRSTFAPAVKAMADAAAAKAAKEKARKSKPPPDAAPQ
jgi:hypothetical protein